jgi:type II secretory pathway pseudopilin PulG
MAGDKLKRKGMLPAATILEVVVAMVIILIVFGTAMMIFANVSRTSLSLKKVNAAAVLQNALATAEHTGQLPETPFMNGRLKIILVLKDVENEPGLKELILAAYDENKDKIAEAREIIIVGHEQ